MNQEKKTVTIRTILSAMNSVMARMVGNRQLCLETSLVSCFTSTVCEFCTSDTAKKHIKYMVGFVREDEDEDGDIEMSFLRRSHKVANKFIMPNTADIGMVKRDQVKVILPDPIGTGTTHRT